MKIGTCTPYPDLAFHACRARYLARKSAAPLQVGTAAKDRFQKPFYIASAAFVGECTLGDDIGIPPGFERGDKVLIPPSVMRVLEDSISGAAMTFEIKSPHGIRTYCGIGGTHRLPGPDGDDLLVLPNWLMRAAAAGELTEVYVRPVALPRLEHVQVLPFTKDFGDLPDPKRFLEYAMTKYSCVALGSVVELQEDGRDLSFYVTGLKPRAPAASAWQGDWESTISLDVLPAQDDVKAVAAASAQRARDRKARRRVARAQWGGAASGGADGTAAGAATAAGAGAGAPPAGGPASGAGAGPPPGMEAPRLQREYSFEDEGAEAMRKQVEEAAQAIREERARRAQVAARMRREGVVALMPGETEEEVRAMEGAAVGEQALRFRIQLMRTPLSSES